MPNNERFQRGGATLKKLFYLFRIEEDTAYLNKKLNDHRTLTALMYVTGACVAILLWGWDIIIDPIAAQETFWLRLCYIFSICGALIFKYVKNFFVLSVTFPIIIVYTLTLFLLILNKLNTGMTYGISGFMIFLMLPLLAGMGFSIKLNFASTIITASAPHIIAMKGIVHGFQHKYYAIIVWPTAVMIMVLQVIFSYNYRLRYNSEAALIKASNTDPMTGASNRRYFMPQLRQEIKRVSRFKHPLSLLMIDIDHFKKINDTYGHLTGDSAICELVEIIQHCKRDIDILARLGGEEFALLLPNTNLDGASLIAERIRNNVESAVQKSKCNNTFNMTVSIGLAEYAGQNSEDQFLNASDTALYQAKRIIQQ